jgi:hypothetical protein
LVFKDIEVSLKHFPSQIKNGVQKSMFVLFCNGGSLRIPEIRNSANVVSLWGNEDALLLYSMHGSESKGRGNYILLKFVFFSESLQKVYVGKVHFALCMP